MGEILAASVATQPLLTFGSEMGGSLMSRRVWNFEVSPLTTAVVMVVDES